MPPTLDRLFVYGTLHPDRAPTEIAHIVSRFISLGTGTVRGQLHHFPHYPALRLNPAGQPVQGTVFRVPDEAWSALDAYEGCIPEAPGQSLFLRERTSVLMDNGSTQECWVYTYARPFPTE